MDPHSPAKSLPTSHPAAASPAPRPAGFVLFAALLVVYLVGHLAVRLLAPDGLHADEAEQLWHSQSLDWGYGWHPPLYTWLVWAASALLGVSLFSLTLVRLAVVGVLYLFAFLSARRVLRDGRLVLPATFALLP